MFSIVGCWLAAGWLTPCRPSPTKHMSQTMVRIFNSLFCYLVRAKRAIIQFQPWSFANAAFRSPMFSTGIIRSRMLIWIIVCGCVHCLFVVLVLIVIKHAYSKSCVGKGYVHLYVRRLLIIVCFNACVFVLSAVGIHNNVSMFNVFFVCVRARVCALMKGYVHI